MQQDLSQSLPHTLDWTQWWSQADAFIHALAFVLCVLSIVAWSVIAEHAVSRFYRRSSPPRQAAVSLLGGIASVAPYIGLLGTVWGIMQTLIALGGNTQLSFQMIAAPLGEALLMTAAGLVVAIPAAAAQRWIQHAHDADEQAEIQALRQRLVQQVAHEGVDQ